ncbi:hypothetical protein [Streptomyces sp. NPDC001536]|uniref:hypothetical protein n=1 Tax=Streptomyces sp. NPDC001536 TaxID=3364583 RepID=UPI0036BD7D47
MHRIVGELAAGGAAVLIASTDLAELTEVCDRVLVFVRGRVTGEVQGARARVRALAAAQTLAPTRSTSRRRVPPVTEIAAIGRGSRSWA